MIDPFVLFIQLVVSLILGIIICLILNLNKKKYLLCSFVLLTIYVIVSFGILTEKRLTTSFKLSNNKTDNADNKVKEGLDNVNNLLNVVVENGKEYTVPELDVEEGTFKDSTLDWHGRDVPIMGPLDGLDSKEMNTRLQFLKQKTAYPYRSITYAEFQTSSDKRIEKDETSLLNKNVVAKNNKQEMNRWYPDSTYLQMNARDCTNYEANHPFSCVQGHTGLLSKEEKVKEEFLSSIPLSLENKLPHPTIFKNAPGVVNDGDVNAGDVVDKSGELCHNCTVGYCSKGICGSRLLDEGNNDIIDVANYVSSYLQDGVF
jgi:hypothetical protein